LSVTVFDQQVHGSAVNFGQRAKNSWRGRKEAREKKEKKKFFASLQKTVDVPDVQLLNS
jgi:hypothetical protein